MDDLALWLTAQLDEDDAEARRGYLKAEPLPDFDGWDNSTTAGLPPAVAARVLREIEAKRRILAAHEREPMPKGDSADCAQCWGAVWPCSTLRLLALPFADRPGFQESWRP